MKNTDPNYLRVKKKSLIMDHQSEYSKYVELGQLETYLDNVKFPLIIIVTVLNSLALLMNSHLLTTLIASLSLIAGRKYLENITKENRNNCKKELDRIKSELIDIEWEERRNECINKSRTVENGNNTVDFYRKPVKDEYKSLRKRPKHIKNR